MKIAIAFATLSGNSATVANIIKKYLQSKQLESSVLDMLSIKADELKKFDLVFMGSSTYDEGLNPIADIFFDMARNAEHQCEQTKFALFALGDSSYPNFATSGEIMRKKLGVMHAIVFDPIFVVDGYPTGETEQKIARWVEKIFKKIEKNLEISRR